MDFSLSFYGEFAKEAIKFFQDFIANTEKPIDERSLKRYKKELREELAELDETYGQYSILRREIFTNHPFDLVSGGLKKEISNITLTQVNKYKSLIKDHGNYFLSYSRNFDPSFIPSLLNPIRASKSLNILPTVKSEKASVPGAIAFILPPISGRRISELFGALDFISNNQDLFKTLSFSLSSQPGLSLFLLFYRQKNAVTKFQKALEDDLLINLAAKYALNVGLERQILPDLCTEDLALDWQNKFDREDLPINKLLQDISVMISSIKLK